MSGRTTALLLALVLSASGSFAAACRSEQGSPAPKPLASATASAHPVVPPLLSPMAASALITNNCLSCHTEEMIAQQRLTPAQWGAVVKKMRGWGAPVDPADIDPLVAYLVAVRGPAAGPHRLTTLPAAEAAAAIAPLPDGPFARGNAARGKATYHDLCAVCHAEDARGAELGVGLADRPLLFRAPEFARIVRSGRGRMPAFNARDVPDTWIADMLAHLRTRH